MTVSDNWTFVESMLIALCIPAILLYGIVFLVVAILSPERAAQVNDSIHEIAEHEEDSKNLTITFVGASIVFWVAFFLML